MVKVESTARNPTVARMGKWRGRTNKRMDLEKYDLAHMVSFDIPASLIRY